MSADAGAVVEFEDAKAPDELNTMKSAAKKAAPKAIRRARVKALLREYDCSQLSIVFTPENNFDRKTKNYRDRWRASENRLTCK
ncbi:hypothetical protein [Arthrobacter sp. GMC3]|uniref:hypothetical protein n=1 Tax=Arthrobacter sp. GMC3 TaxID=2058894 RepID=UPI0015E4438E|nr:hypothetical protein [Arthrobacter sp. GMC3]